MVVAAVTFLLAAPYIFTRSVPPAGLHEIFPEREQLPIKSKEPAANIPMQEDLREIKIESQTEPAQEIVSETVEPETQPSQEQGLDRETKTIKPEYIEPEPQHNKAVITTEENPPDTENVGSIQNFEPITNETGPPVPDNLEVKDLPLFEPINNFEGPPTPPDYESKPLPEFTPITNTTGPVKEDQKK